MLRGRPTGFGEALGSRFDLLRYIARRRQPATLAICLALNGTLLAIISPITTCCDTARCGAILGAFATWCCQKDMLQDADVVPWLAA